MPGKMVKRCCSRLGTIRGAENQEIFDMILSHRRLGQAVAAEQGNRHIERGGSIQRSFLQYGSEVRERLRLTLDRWVGNF